MLPIQKGSTADVSSFESKEVLRGSTGCGSAAKVPACTYFGKPPASRTRRKRPAPGCIGCATAYRSHAELAPDSLHELERRRERSPQPDRVFRERPATKPIWRGRFEGLRRAPRCDEVRQIH